MGSSTAAPLGAGLGLMGALAGLAEALVSFVFVIFGVLASIFSAMFVIIAALAITAIMLPWVKYHDRTIESVEKSMRTVVYPIWRDYVRDWVDLARRIYNPLVCWWNGLNWWAYGMVRQVLIPTALECTFRKLAFDVGALIEAIGKDIILYMASGRFLTEYATFTNITPAGIAVFQDWIDIYMCACSDLGDIFRTLPIVTPLWFLPPVALPLAFFSQQWTDPQTWCALEALFNALMASLQLLIKLATQVLNFLFGNPPPGAVFLRPDFHELVKKLCEFLKCANTSIENAYQVFWDRYIPFKFVFRDFFCTFETLLCIWLNAAAFLIHVIINIDAVVMYPENPYWESVIKPDLVYLINLHAAPTAYTPVRVPPSPAPARYTMENYYLDPASQNTPLGVVNPLYQKRRLVECLCTFITRFLCDPSDESTGCFSQGAQNLLMGFDFCCLVNTVGTLLADIVSAMLEATFHFAKGSDDFFLSLDAQPFTTLIKDDLVVVTRCVFSFFGLIPVVGTCLRELLVSAAAYVLGLVDHAIRVLFGLLTLPYFLIALPGVPNFLTTTDKALNYFVSLNNALIADTAGSFKNCLCAVLNNGFPVPPIPCDVCNVGGFVPPPASKRGDPGRDGEHGTPLTPSLRFFDPHTGRVNSPMALFRAAWGHGDEGVYQDSLQDGANLHTSPRIENDASYAITPLIQYTNHTTNPFVLYNQLWVNVQTLDAKRVMPFPTMRSLDEFVDAKQAELLDRWSRVKSCGAKMDEARTLRERNPRAFAYRAGRGEFSCDAGEALMPAYRGNEKSGTGTGFQESTHNLTDRSTLGPTIPPVVGCSPRPPCFDLCCLARSVLTLAVHILNFLARFMNGLIQGTASQQGTVGDFPYFTGEFASQGKPTFESDFITLILLVFKPIKCACEVLNLIIPVVPTAYTQGRPDLCCAIQRLSELIACIFQVILQAINSLAMGATTNYVYFRGGFFRQDVNALFDITLALVECLCVFVRAIFPFNYIPGIGEAMDFDICCGPSAILVTAVEIGRLVLAMIISIATISSDDSVGGGNAFCYWRLDRTGDQFGFPAGSHYCGGSLDEIGIIKQIDVILDSFFPRHGFTNDPNKLPSAGTSACYENCNYDNGVTGIVPCICQLFNTLVPFRRFPNKPVSCSYDPAERNCQELDLCCPFSKIGFFLADLTKFTARAVAAAWQPWDGALPEFLIHYIWCAEETSAPCPRLQIKYPNECEKQVNTMIPVCAGTFPVLNATSQINFRCGKYTCGKFNIVIDDLTHPFDGLIAKCTCEFFSLLDRLIALIYQVLQIYVPQAGWACCFCGGLDPSGSGQCSARTVSPCAGGAFNSGSGILPALSFIVNAVLRAVTDLARKFPLSCYWKPAPGGGIPSLIRETWIFSFLGPTADALAIATGNLMCIATSTFLLPQFCLKAGQRFLGSIIRWVAEIIIRVVGFIEAFVATLIASGNSCIGSKDACEGRQGAGKTTKGVNSKKLGNMLVILLSIPIDILIGDSHVACTTVCPSIFAVPTPMPCDCWNLAPFYGGGYGRPVYDWVQDTDPSGNGICKDMSKEVINSGIIRHVGTPFGTNTSGYPYPLRGPPPQNQILYTFNMTTNKTQLLGYIPAGCCRLNFVPDNSTTIPVNMPICQSPDDSKAPGTIEAPDESCLKPGEPGYPGPCTGAGDPGYPGSCVVLTACRADALPSVANDPITPLGLSANYVGAIDGIVMGFTRYLRCLLDHLFTCPNQGMLCNSDLQFGIIFYPLILIESISWQILGGVIRFLAAIGIFFFSLFTPPSGASCSCWQHDVLDPYNVTKTQYFRITGALCYRCRALDMECDKGVTYGPNLVVGLRYRCNEYCPAHQIIRDPGISEVTAIARCEADYNILATKKIPVNQPAFGNPTITANMVCTGVWPQHNVTEQIAPMGFALSIPGRPLTRLIPGCSVTGPESCLCAPLDGIGSMNGGIFGDPIANDVGRFLVLDFCPNPSCRNVGPGYDAYPGPAFWPCGGGGGSILDTSYPADPLVTCGALQIISAGLDVFKAFVEIFTQPLIPPTDKKRGEGEHAEKPLLQTVRDALSHVSSASTPSRDRFVGPVRREPRQAFNKRIKSSNSPRFDGTVYGIQAEGPNAAEALVSAIYDYDTSDCYDDPVTCACRNLDMMSHCYVDETGQLAYGAARKRRVVDVETGRDEPVPMTEADITTLMADEMFTGQTVCDHTAASMKLLDWNANSSMSRKNQWVKCVDKMIQGSRMNTLADVFPTDITYNSQAPVTLVRNVFHYTQQALKKRHVRAAMDKVPHEDEFETAFPNYGQQLHERTMFARDVLIQEYGITPDHIMFDAILKFDRMWFKYASGYYGFSMRKLVRVISTGEVTFPSTQEALHELHESVVDMKRIIMSQRYGDLADASVKAVEHMGRAAGIVMEEGPIQFVKRSYAELQAHGKKRFEESTKAEEVERLKQSFYESPAYKWWTGAGGPGAGEWDDEETNSTRPPVRTHILAPFVSHMSNFIGFQRQHWETHEFSFWTADLHFISLKDAFVKRFSNPRWTPEQLANWDKIKGAYYAVQERIWPGSVSHEHKERFLFNSNCKLIDRTVNLTIKVVDYCANNALNNMRRGWEKDVHEGGDHYFARTSLHRPDTYHGWRTRSKWTLRPSSATSSSPHHNDPHAWLRPRWITPNRTTPLSHRVDYREYRRAVTTPMEVHGPANWNFYDWLVVVIEDWTGWALGAQRDSLFDEIQAWLFNPNDSIANYPNVGLAYWIKFPFVCNFPESLNCSIGEGIESGLVYATLALIGCLLVGAYVFAPITLPFQLIGYGFLWAMIAMAVAWHLPPACVVLVPSFPFGVSFAFPECALDQLIAFLDKWITTCYVPLVIPSYMVSGVPCPTDPTQSIDMLNCRDVGVSDGIQNILFLGVWFLGSGFVDFLLQVTATVIGAFIPGLQAYMQTTLTDFQNSNPTQKQRQWFCFYATLPTIVTPLILLLVFGIVLALLVPAILHVLEACVTLFMASPAADVVPGSTAGQAWFGTNENDLQPVGEGEGEEEEEPMVPVQARVNTLGDWMRKQMFGAPSVTRRKKMQ
jgi:hypothetical protein